MSSRNPAFQLAQASQAWAMAAIGSATWDEAVAATAKGLQADGGVIFSPGDRWRARQLAAFHGTLVESSAEYAAHWIHRDAWTLAAKDKPEFQRAGAVAIGSEILPEKALWRTDFYNDFCKPWGTCELVSLKVCDDSDRTALQTHLSFFRNEGDGHFDDSAKRLLLDLWPHIQRAVHTYWRLEKAREAEVTGSGLLDSIPSAIFVLWSNGNVDYANPAGISLLRDFGERGAGERMINTLPGMLHGELRDALCQCSIGLSYGRAAFATNRAGSRVRLRLSFTPIVNDPVFTSLWPNSCALITVDQENADKDVQRRLQLFCVSYRLSKKESEVLALLIKGWDVPAVADALGLAYSTARTHVASILGKTQSSRQTELLAKVFGT